jgi:predicted O-methyltransferase YrrM
METIDDHYQAVQRWAPGPESRFTQPRPECPDPDRWHSTDSDSTEIEVSRLVAAFVEALRPDLVVETGTAFGQTAELIGAVLRDAGVGRLVTFETDAERVVEATDRCVDMPVDVVQQPSLEGVQSLIDDGMQGMVRFAWLDSLFELRVPELRLIRPLLARGAVVGVHDCGEPGRTKFNDFAHAVSVEAEAMGFNRISLPTPRGVSFLSWRG